MRGNNVAKQSLGDCIRLDSSPSCLSLRSPLFLSLRFSFYSPLKEEEQKKVKVFFIFFYFRLKSLGTKILLDYQ